MNEVHPELAKRVRLMAYMLSKEGIEIRITQGLRSWNQQKEIWLKGRNELGVIIDPKLIVTHAAPGHSWHQFGLSADVAPFAQNIPDWNIQHPAWQRIVKVGWVVGLDSGSTWRTFPDWPHLQLPGIPQDPTDEIRQTFLDAGMVAVWQSFKNLHWETT